MFTNEENSYELRDYLKIYQFPTSRRLFVLNSMLAAARRHREHELERRIEQARDQDRKLRQTELAFSPGRRPKHSPKAKAMDSLVDRHLSGFDNMLQGLITFSGEDSPQGQQARKIRQSFFPKGVQAISNLPYVEQHETLEVQLALLLEQENATILVELGLMGFVSRLIELNKEYGEVVGVRDPNELDSNKLREYQRQGQREFAKVLIAVFARFLDEDSQSKGHDFLKAFVDQNNSIGESYRHRSVVTDVDPDTGLEIPQLESPETVTEPDAELEPTPAFSPDPEL